MEFSYIDPKIPVKEFNTSRCKFRSMMIELGVRDANHHVSSGLGGNNFQLLTLMGMKHALLDSNSSIGVAKDKITWGAKWLTQETRVGIRKELDKKFESILEKNKLMALPLQILSDSPEQLRKGFLQYKNNFPNLSDWLDGKSVSCLKLSRWERLVAAFIVCQDLARELDNGTATDKKITSAGTFLSDCSPEIILLSVRRYIQIHRIVKHNLDEHPGFCRMLLKVNDVIDR